LKAAILEAQNTPLVVADLEVPALDVGQVLVKVEYSGVCGKQMEEISGRRGDDPYLPHLLGHEGAGIVEVIGPGVRKVKPGDHVVMHWVKGPGIDSAPPRFSRNGKTVSAGWVTTFSERTVVSENRVTGIPDDMPFDVAALLGCAVTTGLGIVFNNAGLRPGQSIAVFGVGGVGLNVIQGAAMVSAHPIVAIDLHDNKLEQAAAFGATHIFNSSNGDAHEYLMELSEGNGFDATVDVTGNNGVRQTAYDSTENTGKTIFAGVPYVDEQITIDSFPLHFGRRMIGSHGGETKPDVDIPRYVQLYKLGKLKLDEQISRRFGLDDINDAVETVRSGEAGRCLISMTQ
jgi:S-(hydroxymethyl)glutathione dehydrogenase/alcohol dehydrogenase